MRKLIAYIEALIFDAILFSFMVVLFVAATWYFLVAAIIDGARTLRPHVAQKRGLLSDSALLSVFGLVDIVASVAAFFDGVYWASALLAVIGGVCFAAAAIIAIIDGVDQFAVAHNNNLEQ